MNHARLNEADLRLAVHLDEFPESFVAVMPIWEKLRMSKYQVLGKPCVLAAARKQQFAGSTWADQGPLLDCREW